MSHYNILVYIIMSFDNITIKKEVKDYINSNLQYDKSDIKHISNWDVSGVTDMSELFKDLTNFNDDISNWNVSNVTNMSRMFSGAKSFNQDIGRWTVSNVTDMSNMFSVAESFNQDIGRWTVSNVTDMSRMFFYAESFNQDIGRWTVSKVTDMSNMFSYTKSFNQDISSWTVSKVTNMSNMFHYAVSFNQDIGRWNVSNVTDMSYMFGGTKSFNQDISRWNVSNVTNMTNMFSYAESFNQKYKPIKNYSPSIKRAFINYKINIQDRSNSKSNINYNVKRINLKNTEIGTGMAWEIHKVFNEYYILDFYKEVYAFNCSKKYTTIKENRFISTLTNWINMDTINLKNKELENFFICIKQVNQKLLNISLDNNFILLLSVVFTFIQNNFEKDDQHKYAYNIYYDNCAAYGNKIEVIDGNIDGMTCAKGLIERIVVNVINIFSAKRNEKSGLYKKTKLTSVFGFFPPKKEKNIYNSFFMEKEFLEYMNDWKEVNNGKIKQIINNDKDKYKDIPNALKDNFFKYLTIKYNKTKETCIKTKYADKITYYFKEWRDYLDDEYLNTNYDEKATGGKHKKTQKRKKRTKKTRKKKYKKEKKEKKDKKKKTRKKSTRKGKYDF